MIRSRLTFITLIALSTPTTAALAVDKEKLRRAVFLPQISINAGYALNRWGEIFSFAEFQASPNPASIAAVEKELKGDATDAELYNRLAKLYFRARQPDKGKEARRKAAALWRKQFQDHPDDITIQLQLAEALERMDKSEEAGSLVRRVLKDHPKDWHAWLLLGVILDLKSEEAISGGKSLNLLDPEGVAKSLRDAQTSPERIAASQRFHEEAIQSFDRAVHLAPEETEVYRQRGASRYQNEWLDCSIRIFKGENVDPIRHFPGHKSLPDLRRALTLHPDHYKLLAFVVSMEAIWECYHADSRNPSAKPPKNVWDDLPEGTRKRLRDDLARLEKGAQAPDKHKAAEATAVLAYLNIVLFADAVAAEKYARRSIELDPMREEAWDILLGIVMTKENYRKVVAVCRQHLEHQDSARNRLFLAKAYAYRDQLDKAEEILRTGLKRQPDYFMLRLALADMLLMRGDEESVKQAGQILSELREEEIAEGGAEENRWANYTFTYGVYFGLISETERAKQWLDAVLKHKPDHPGLGGALKALAD